jgi:hypothetical protein
VTAQDLFTSAMKEAFAPALRRAGLRGSSPSFYIPSESHFAMLGFQKSQFSYAAEVKFTLNLKVVSKDAWEGMRATRPDFPAKPAPNTGYGTFEWNRRIGHLLPSGEDTWWHLRVDQDNAPTISAVVDVLVNIAAPALRTQLDTTAGE